MLKLNAINIAYGSHKVVHQLSFHLKDGEIGCLLGPSGCGKTSTLRAVAGFEPLQQGQIILRNEVVSQPHKTLPPEKRRMAVVFQDLALFPHLTVLQNIAFGLHRMPAKQQSQRVAEVLALVGLEGTQPRYPHQLSGGQQQRIALARALAPRPDLLLLDEPFSSLDAELREELAKDIRTILKQENTTALMVTHDQHEAFAMADVIGVLKEGRMHQWADAYALYHRPSTRFVADFVGSGVFLKGRVTASSQIESLLGRFNFKNVKGLPVGQAIELLVRPDDIEHDDDSPVKATVTDRVFRGAHILYELAVPPANEKVLCLAPSHHDHGIGESFGIRLDLAHTVIFPL